MKNNFPFFEIKTNKRRRIFKQIYEENKLEVAINPGTIAVVLHSKQDGNFIIMRLKF